MKTCAIIYNPESGHLKNKRLIRKIVEVLKKKKYLTALYQTEYEKHAEIIMENLPNYDLVICAGGDGTLNEIIEGNFKRKTKLLIAHLPFGTTNDVGHMFGYTKNHLRDLNMLLSGEVRNVDVCKINEKHFIYVACFGNFVDVSYKTPRRWKKKYGQLAYIFYTLTKFGEQIKMSKIKYIVDGIEKSGEYSFVFVTNSNRVAGMGNIYKDVKLDDNMFEVALFKSRNQIELLRVISQLLITDIRNIPNIEYIRTNNIKLEFEKTPSNSWGVDGEEYKHRTKDFDFKVTKEMQMLLPKRNIKKLFE